MSVASLGCNRDAERRLRAAQVQVSEVVWVDIDSILYLDAERRPMTAWLRGDLTRTEPGFCATRGVLFHDEPGFAAGGEIHIEH